MHYLLPLPPSLCALPGDVVVARRSFLSMNLQELNLLANGPTIQLINWLQARNLLSARLRCAPCQQGMVLARRDADHVDGYQW